MAQVTVQQLAEVVGASAERLLTQMKEAGLPHTEAEQAVSDEDKQTLLAYLKRSHGESTDAPKRITLKRKTISTLKTSGSQGKKTVNVEVRKKRTYVKRADLVAEEQERLDKEAFYTSIKKVIEHKQAIIRLNAAFVLGNSSMGIREAPAITAWPGDVLLSYSITPCQGWH